MNKKLQGHAGASLELILGRVKQFSHKGTELADIF